MLTFYYCLKIHFKIRAKNPLIYDCKIRAHVSTSHFHIVIRNVY